MIISLMKIITQITMIMKVLTITTMNIMMMYRIKTKTNQTNIQQKMLLLIYQETVELAETIKIITTTMVVVVSMEIITN